MAVAWQRKWAFPYNSSFCVLRNNDVNRQAKSVQTTKYFLIALQLFPHLWNTRWCKKGVSGTDMVAILQTWKLWPVAWRDTSSSKLKTSMSNSPSLLRVNRLWVDGEYTQCYRRVLMSSYFCASLWKYENTHSRFGKLWPTTGGGLLCHLIQYFPHLWPHCQCSQKTSLF